VRNYDVGTFVFQKDENGGNAGFKPRSEDSKRERILFGINATEIFFDLDFVAPRMGTSIWGQPHLVFESEGTLVQDREAAPQSWDMQESQAANNEL